MNHKLIIFFVYVCISIGTYAQAPKLVAMTSEGGVIGSGTIIQYSGGDTSIAQICGLTLGNPQNVTLVQAPNGKFYASVDDGGTTSFDAIIEYDYGTNTYIKLANFDASTGTAPAGSLLLIGDSTFYGLAETGGANGSGTLFSYTIGSSSITKLYDLPAGAYPGGSLIQSADGNLYGMTQNDGAHGSGTIFSYNLSSRVYTPLYSLPTYAHPLGRLLEIGIDTFYGLVFNDSIHHVGSIFRFVPDSNYTVLYYLPGAHAEGSLIRATDGLLYGMTTDGGTYSSGLYSGGMLFNFNIQTQFFDTLHNFGSGTDGAYPLGDLYQASDGMLYGMANEGGSDRGGTIFQYNIATHTYTMEVSLDGAHGYFPGFGHFSEYMAAPLIYSQPAASTVCADSAGNFTVGDSGTNVSTQWQVSSNGGGSFSNISSATGASYNFVASSSLNGNLYRAVLTGSAGSDTSTAVVLTVDSCTAAGIDEIPAFQFSLYPNPGNGVFTLHHNYTGKLTVKIVNLLGANMEEFNLISTTGKFDVSNLAAGMYQVQISNATQTLKVIKLVRE